MSASQVDDGRIFVFHCVGECIEIVRLHVSTCNGLSLHAHAAPRTAAEDLHVTVMIRILVVETVRDINEDVAAALHDITVAVAGIALSRAIDVPNAVVFVILQFFGQCGTEIHEGIAHTRFGVAAACFACHMAVNIICFCCIEIFAIVRVFVVVCTVAAAEDGIGASLCVLDVGRSCEQCCVVHFADGIIVIVFSSAHTAGEIAVCLGIAVGTCLAQYASAQVVAAVNHVADKGEAFTHGSCLGIHLSSDVSLGMSENVGHT